MTKLSECSGFSVAAAGGGGYTPPPWYNFTPAKTSATSKISWPTSSHNAAHTYYMEGCTFGYKSNKFCSFAHIQSASDNRFKCTVSEVNPNTGAITILANNDVYTNTSQTGSASGYSMFTFKNAAVGTGYSNSPGSSGAGYEHWGFTINPTTGVTSGYTNVFNANTLSTGPNEYPQAWNFHQCHSKPSGDTHLVFFSQSSAVNGLWVKDIVISQSGAVDLSNSWTIDANVTSSLNSFYHTKISNNSAWDCEASGDYINYIASFKEGNDVKVAVSDSAGNYTVHNMGAYPSGISYTYGYRMDDGSIVFHNTAHGTYHHFTAHNTVTALPNFDPGMTYSYYSGQMVHCSNSEIYLPLTGNPSHTSIANGCPYAKLSVTPANGFAIGALHGQNGLNELDKINKYAYLGGAFVNSTDTSPSYLVFQDFNATGPTIGAFPTYTAL